MIDELVWGVLTLLIIIEMDVEEAGLSMSGKINMLGRLIIRKVSLL